MDLVVIGKLIAVIGVFLSVETTYWTAFLMTFDSDENVNESRLKSAALSGGFLTKLIKVIRKACLGGWGGAD